MSLALAILPIALLIAVMTSPWPRRWLPLPAHIALPGAAVLAYLLQVLWFRAGRGGRGAGDAARWIHAGVIDGALSALTPLAIVFGAVLLFRTLEESGAMRVLTRWIRGLTRDSIAQLVLIGWSFSFLIEGLSGFGTPAALAAPILVGLGFPPVRVAALTLVMNSVPVSFGAVGTPVWFGLGEIGLSDEDLRAIGFRAAAVNTAAAMVVPLLALRIVAPWPEIRARLGFVLLVVAASVVPYLIVARWSTEFPSIIGGLSGTVVGALAAWLRIGLPHGAQPAAAEETREDVPGPRPLGVLRAATPLLAVILILAVTRIDQLGIRPLLTSDRGAARLSLGGLGEAWVSPGLVVGLRGILGTETAWRMPLLYTPFILPFVAAAVLAIPLLRIPPAVVARTWGGTAQRLARPAVALVGALVLVKMMMLGQAGAPAMIMGRAMADAAGGSWPHFAPLLGALGAFFSGSNTVSNLTFAPVQAAVAASLGLDVRSVLALQTVGGSLGNMVCIHNIVAVAAVLGLRDSPARGGEGASPRGSVGAILRLTAGPMLVYAAIAGVLAVFL